VPGLRPPSAPPGGLVKTRQQRKNPPRFGVHLGNPGLEQWIEDCLDTDRGQFAFTTTRVLFTSWKGWAEQRNLHVGSETAFTETLAEKGYEQNRKKYGRGFKGIELKSPDAPESL
jgi:hypothetical protein